MHCASEPTSCQVGNNMYRPGITTLTLIDRKYLYEDLEANDGNKSTPEGGNCEADDVEARIACLKGIKRRRIHPKDTPSPLSAAAIAESPVTESKQRAPKLPPFIKSTPTNSPEHTSFLESQGAYELPSTPVQCALIKAYVEFAYPRMPVIDLDEFGQAIRSSNGTPGQISLVLYQAILFSGSAYIAPEDVGNEGFAEKKDLRRELYRRTKVLPQLAFRI